MLVSDIEKFSKGNLINGNENIEINKFLIDNREENIDECFYIPLVGKKVDAHDFIVNSVEKGIIGFFINKNYINKEKVIKESIMINSEIVIIEVEDTLKALYNISVYNRKLHLDIPVIAITGSVGKTSTRQMIYSVVKQEKNVLVTEKNYNGYLGLSLMGLKIKDQDVCILEAGIDRFGEMDELSQILLPDIAVITMIGTSHIERFKTKENIFKEKMCITKTLRGINTLIINKEDEYLSKIKDNQNYNIKRYSIEEITDLKIENKKITFYTKIYNKNEKIVINAIGKHNVTNAIAAIKVGELLNISTKNIIKGISEYRNFDRRLEVKTVQKNVVLIDDSYNASADSMISGLNTINLMDGRKIAVLGDMLELGKYSDVLHKKVGEEFKNLNFDILITIGEHSVNINKKANKYVKQCLHFSNMQEAQKCILKNIKENDIVYFKASNSMNFSYLINYIMEKI